MDILAIGAHPDDIDFTVGATISKLVASNEVTVHYCLVTNGQAGGSDLAVPRCAQARQRQEEQEAAAQVLGVSQSFHLDRPDGLLEPTLDLRRDLTRIIRLVKPAIVIAPSPRYNLDDVHFLHPDHLAVGAATLAAVYPDSRNQFAFPELCLDSHIVKQVWLVEDPEPDFFVEIGEEDIALKLEALAQHSSQFATKNDLESEVRHNASRLAKTFEKDVEYAEGFRRIIYEPCQPPGL